METQARAFVAIMAFALAIAAPTATAQQATRVPRIAYVWLFSQGPSAPHGDAFRERMCELGYVEGKTLQAEYLDAGGSGTKLDAIGWDGTQSLLNSGDSLLGGETRAIVERAAKLKIPGMFEDRYFVEMGGLMSYGPDYRKLHRRAADYVDKILKGAKPGDLPIEQPTKFEFVINKKTAKALGVALPNTVLLQADEIIE
jgi:hypothetical protein